MFTNQAGLKIKNLAPNGRQLSNRLPVTTFHYLISLFFTKTYVGMPIPRQN